MRDSYEYDSFNKIFFPTDYIIQKKKVSKTQSCGNSKTLTKLNLVHVQILLIYKVKCVKNEYVNLGTMCLPHSSTQTQRSLLKSLKSRH